LVVFTAASNSTISFLQSDFANNGKGAASTNAVAMLTAKMRFMTVLLDADGAVVVTVLPESTKGNYFAKYAAALRPVYISVIKPMRLNPYAMMIPQLETERPLEEKLQKLGVTIERSVEAISIRRHRSCHRGRRFALPARKAFSYQWLRSIAYLKP
jgi:hypothetical protein